MRRLGCRWSAHYGGTGGHDSPRGGLSSGLDASVLDPGSFYQSRRVFRLTVCLSCAALRDVHHVVSLRLRHRNFRQQTLPPALSPSKGCTRTAASVADRHRSRSSKTATEPDFRRLLGPFMPDRGATRTFDDRAHADLLHSCCWPRCGSGGVSPTPLAST